MNTLCRALCALLLSMANVSRAQPAAALHADPEVPVAAGEAEDEDLAKWKAKVQERKAPELFAGLDSDDFHEREASSFEVHRRVLDGKLPVRDVVEAGLPLVSPEVRMRLEKLYERLLGDEKSLKEFLRLAADGDTPAAMRRRTQGILDAAPRIEWKPLLTRLRAAVEKKLPPAGTPGDLLEKILEAMPVAARKQMKADAEKFPRAKGDERTKLASRTQEALLAAAKKLGLTTNVLPAGGGLLEMAKITVIDPKSKTGLSYRLEVTPGDDEPIAVRLRTQVTLLTRDIVPSTAKLPSGEWALKVLPEKTSIVTGQVATALPGDSKRAHEQQREKGKELSRPEADWFDEQFPKHFDEIGRAFGLPRA